MQRPLQRTTLVTTAALAAAFFSVAAQAAGTTPSVEVHGTRVQRVDLQAACPAAKDALAESLASAWQFGRTAEVKVAFVVEGGRVTQVQALSGPADYRRRVAQALRELPCSEAGGTQGVTMTVRFA